MSEKFVINFSLTNPFVGETYKSYPDYSASLLLQISIFYGLTQVIDTSIPRLDKNLREIR